MRDVGDHSKAGDVSRFVLGWVTLVLLLRRGGRSVVSTNLSVGAFGGTRVVRRLHPPEIDQLFEDEGFVTPSCSLVKHSGLVGSVGIMLKSSCRESTGATTPTANVSCVSLNAVGTMPSGPTM